MVTQKSIIGLGPGFFGHILVVYNRVQLQSETKYQDLNSQIFLRSSLQTW